MTSPVTVTTTPTLLVKANLSRQSVLLQNNSKQDVYIKKQKLFAPYVVPTTTNYDFILHGSIGEGDGESLEILDSVAAFIGVTDKQTATVAVSEIVKVKL